MMKAVKNERLKLKNRTIDNLPDIYIKIKL